jgi:competence protein ComEA
MVSKTSDDNVQRSRPDETLSDAAETSSPAEQQPASFLWLTNRDQWLVVVVSVVVVILLAAKWQQLRYIDRSEIILQRGSEDIGYQIELNSATWVELTQLRGIGEAIAQRIVNDRNERGPYSSIDDLQRVDGIGPKTVARNRRWLRVESKNSSLR